MNDLLEKCERAAKARLNAPIDHPAKLIEYQQKRAQIEAEKANDRISSPDDLDAQLKRHHDALNNLEIPFELNAIAMLEFLSEVRTAAATRDVTTAVRAAIMVGGLAERLGVEIDVAAGQKHQNIAVARDRGKSAKVASRRQRWHDAARAIRTAEPNVLRPEAAKRITKQENDLATKGRKETRLQDPGKYITIYRAIGCIFQK